MQDEIGRHGERQEKYETGRKTDLNEEVQLYGQKRRG